MSDETLEELKSALGHDHVYVARYYECNRSISGDELAEAIDAFVRKRLSEAAEGKV